MDQQIGDWIAWLVARGLSPMTVRAYAWQVRQFVKVCDRPVPADYAARDLVGYIAGRSAWSASARKLAANALRSFFGWALGSASPAASLPVAQPKRRRQRTLSAVEVEAIGSAIDTMTVLGRRDLALFALALDTGLRASELCRLQLYDVDLSARSLVVVVKGGQEAMGVYVAATANALLGWYAVRGQLARPDIGAVFVGMHGGPLTPVGLQDLCRRWALRAGIPRFSPHALRRSMATLATAAGAPTRLVQAAGRWSDLAMVERYTQALDPSAIEPYSPVQRWLGSGGDVKPNA